LCKKRSRPEDLKKNRKNPLRISLKTGFVHGSGRQVFTPTGVLSAEVPKT